MRLAAKTGAVHIYTQGWVESAHSLYAILNHELSKEDRGALKVW